MPNLRYGLRTRADPGTKPSSFGAMHEVLTPSARLLGVASGAAVALLCLVYLCVLTVGLLTLPSPAHPIQQPWFFLMEVLIIGIAPAMVAFTVALHAGARPDRKSLALASVVFMGMCAVVTCAVHFAILTLGRRAAFAGEPRARQAFSFEWPSIAYALDILAWDIFFPVAALFAATAVQGTGLAKGVRGLLFGSAVLAFSGLAGAALDSMQIRNIGILGYAVLFPVAAGAMAILLLRTTGANSS
jgi:hypothetical protein